MNRNEYEAYLTHTSNVEDEGLSHVLNDQFECAVFKRYGIAVRHSVG